ncbi:Hint domain-containing protein [Halomonas sp. KAO]|uniref:Hint domain-containing protein n=1 Tax=Halomonas sp. KAO TaxID=2783858 RepID=UPI0018A0CF24|nr:Hint domain-containing protein [Halomonas sp. KAO]MBF7052347.1 Hint domain-containing protein [Halomonas sp. KAO]
MALLDLDLLENSSHTINDQNADDNNTVNITALGSSELIVDGVAADVNSIAGVQTGAQPTFTATNGGEMNIDQGLLNVGLLNNTTFKVDGNSSMNLESSTVSALDGLNALNVEFTGEQPGTFTYDKPDLGVLSTVNFNVNGAKAGDQFQLAGGDTWELDDGLATDAYRDGALHLKGGGLGALQTRVNAKINMTQQEYNDWVNGRSNSDINNDLANEGFTFPGEPVCFAAGTLIATPEGETTVETLAIGDSILTASGETVAVKWIGRQSLRPVAAGEKFQAVRVSQGALGDNIPSQDLTLTAGHGLIIDDLVINAGVLVNHDTIRFVPSQELPAIVTYYHVETENHEVIIANGTPAETYVDYIDRQAFDNYAEYVALYGNETRIVEMPRHRIASRRLLPLSVRQQLNIEDALYAAKTA